MGYLSEITFDMFNHSFPSSVKMKYNDSFWDNPSFAPWRRYQCVCICIFMSMMWHLLYVLAYAGIHAWVCTHGSKSDSLFYRLVNGSFVIYNKCVSIILWTCHLWKGVCVCVHLSDISQKSVSWHCDETLCCLHHYSVFSIQHKEMKCKVCVI